MSLKLQVKINKYSDKRVEVSRLDLEFYEFMINDGWTLVVNQRRTSSHKGWTFWDVIYTKGDIEIFKASEDKKWLSRFISNNTGTKFHCKTSEEIMELIKESRCMTDDELYKFVFTINKILEEQKMKEEKHNLINKWVRCRENADWGKKLPVDDWFKIIGFKANGDIGIINHEGEVCYYHPFYFDLSRLADENPITKAIDKNNQEITKDNILDFLWYNGYDTSLKYSVDGDFVVISTKANEICRVNLALPNWLQIIELATGKLKPLPPKDVTLKVGDIFTFDPSCMNDTDFKITKFNGDEIHRRDDNIELLYKKYWYVNGVKYHRDNIKLPEFDFKQYMLDNGFELINEKYLKCNGVVVPLLYPYYTLSQHNADIWIKMAKLGQELEEIE